MENSKIYDLEVRTQLFVKNCRLLIGKLTKTISNIEDSKQLVRSSGSIAANNIEANEKLGDKDFIIQIKDCKKRSKGIDIVAKTIKRYKHCF